MPRAKFEIENTQARFKYCAKDISNRLIENHSLIDDVRHADCCTKPTEEKEARVIKYIDEINKELDKIDKSLSKIDKLSLELNDYALPKTTITLDC